MKHEIQALIEKLSMESYTQYEIRGMLQELVDAQDSPFVEDGLLAIPEESVFDGMKEVSFYRSGEKDTHVIGVSGVHKEKILEHIKLQKPKGEPWYMIDTSKMLEGETFQQTIDRLGLKPIGE